MGSYSNRTGIRHTDKQGKVPQEGEDRLERCVYKPRACEASQPPPGLGEAPCRLALDAEMIKCVSLSDKLHFKWVFRTIYD